MRERKASRRVMKKEKEGEEDKVRSLFISEDQVSGLNFRLKLVFIFIQVETKQDEGEEKDHEFFGKLEYTLDYNFTDNQVGIKCKSTFMWLLMMINLMMIL